MIIFFLLPALCLVSGYNAASPQLQKFVSGNQKFSADVYQEIVKLERGNFMVSPLSAEIVLALAGAGAGGTTGNEIRNTLQLPARQQEVNHIFSEVMPTLRSTNNYQLTTANRIFVNSSFEVPDNYRNLASRYYYSGVENLDFAHNVQSANLVNQWVEQQTNNKIRNIVSPSDITTDLALILVNTLYFNANWSKQFESIPGLQSFYGDNGQSTAVEMMSLTNVYNYYDSQKLDCQILEIPYIGNDVSMIIALPRQRSGLARVERYIGDILSHDRFTSERVYVELPKFSTETSIQFNQILQNLGIRRAFTNAADFSGIGHNVKISKVIQKTFINVTESGTEAAAATTVYAVAISAISPEPLHFIANHSFLYVIRSKDNTILFVGRFNG